MNATTTDTKPQTAVTAPAAAQRDADDRINRIPGYRAFEATANLPEDQMLAIRWLHGHYWDSGKSLGEIGKLIGYDGGNVSKLFHGKYEGDLDAVVKSINRYRKLTEERASVNRAPYIETQLYREIEEACQMALTYQKIVHIYGESQVGKTAALTHYAEKHNHGETIMVKVPAGGSMIAFCTAMATQLRMNPATKLAHLQPNIIRSITSRNLVLIDEAHRIFQARSYSGQTMKTADFIRDMQEDTGCGLVLCGTNVFREQMRDKGWEQYLKQFTRRPVMRKQLPDIPQRADLNAFARHYGMAPASGDAFLLQRAVVREHGLGVWLTTLTAASRAATRQGKPMTWEHVLKAHAFFQSLEKSKPDDEEEKA